LNSEDLCRPTSFLVSTGIFTLLLTSGPTEAAPRTYRFDEGSELVYRVTSPFHTIEGTSHRIEGQFRMDAGTPVPVIETPVRLSVELASLDSGNRNRDRHMRETMRAPLFPRVSLRLDHIHWDPPTGRGTPGTASGSVEMLGIERPVDVTLLGQRSEDRLTVEATFEVRLETHGVERPRFLMQPIDDRVPVRFRGVAVSQP
jgi:polyisoprenoid-binding protein YceI